MDYSTVWKSAVSREVVPHRDPATGGAMPPHQAARLCDGYEALGYETNSLHAVRCVVEQEACLEVVRDLNDPELSHRFAARLSAATIRGAVSPSVWDPEEPIEADSGWSVMGPTGAPERCDVCLIAATDDNGVPGIFLADVEDDPLAWVRDAAGREVLDPDLANELHPVRHSLASRRGNWLVWLGAGSLGVYRRQLEDIVVHTRDAKTSSPSRWHDARHRVVDVHVLIEGARLLLKRALARPYAASNTALCALAIEDVRASLSSLRRHTGFAANEPAGIDGCSGLRPSLAYDELLREVLP